MKTAKRVPDKIMAEMVASLIEQCGSRINDWNPDPDEVRRMCRMLRARRRAHRSTKAQWRVIEPGSRIPIRILRKPEGPNHS